TQIYTGDDKDLDDLQVTGTGIQWYAAATGNTTLPNSTLLADGTTYYASQTIAGVESTERLAITVNRISDNTQNYSPGDTVADLGSTPSTGATATWYTSASSSTALTNTEVLSAGTYYVDETTPEIIETLGSGSFVSPFGVGVQSDGKIVLSSGAIWRMNANGTGIEILNTGFAGANGIAIQSDDKIVVADNINSTINRINADGSNTEPLGLGFSNPSDVAIQSDGKILVADTGNNAIKRMNADGTGVENLGTGFNNPRGVAVQSDGKILVADTGNNAIKRMNADGTVIETLGIGFNNPRGVVIQLDGKILVSDTGNNTIKRMNVDGTGVETLSTGFNNPIGVAVQSDGKTLVADTGNNAIRRITEAYTSNRVAVIVEQQPTLAPTTTYPTQIYTGDDKDLDDLQVTGTGIQWYAAATGNTTLSNTTLLADGTTYYASQTLGSIESTARLAITVNRISDNIQEFSSGDTVADLVSTPSTGVTATWYTTASDGTALTGVDVLSAGTYYVEEIRLETLETLGTGFSNPFGVAVQSDGKILVADSNNNAIKRMNADGTGIEVLGNGFNFSYSIAVQSDGKVLVADTFNNAIKRMNEDGTGIETLGSGFLNPTGIAVQSDGKILVADSNNNGIKRMNADGTGIEILGSGFNSLIGVAVQSDGKILVADIGDNAIKRMNADGSNIETLGTGFLAPYSAAVQSDGKILVADTGNNEIKRMNADGTGIEVLSSSVFNPSSIALQSDGKILAADPVNSSIRRITEAYTSNRVAVTVSETLSIDDVDINNSLLLYPNPAKDKLFITTSNGLLIKSITLIDALGRNVFTVDKQNVIDVSNISNGVLLLKIKTNKGTITKRVVKQ
ncbi:virginiamycin B lyase family protein, partial [Kordia sp.]|uniref:virginiamycin B lyase family protein n=1 Tax=Kordia sp. TaxID=1965332 RepID=UPI003D6A56F8